MNILDVYFVSVVARYIISRTMVYSKMSSHARSPYRLITAPAQACARHVERPVRAHNMAAALRRRRFRETLRANRRARHLV